MIAEILTIISGTLLGIFTGLMPGLHINLLSVIILSVSAQYFSGSAIIPALLILSTGIAQNFSEAIQTTFFSAPTAETALLPAQQMLKQGKGHEAVQHFVVGALFGTIASIILSPLLFTIIPFAYTHLKNFTALLLTTIVIILILKEKTLKQKIWALVVVIFSGIFGTMILNSSVQQPLFLMLSSLFGASSLLTSLANRTRICEQKIEELQCSGKNAVKASTGAAASLMMTTLMPGIGATQASFLPSAIMRVSGSNYITLLGSIGTADFIVSMIAFATINKARSGAIASITQLTQISTSTILTFFSTALITAGIATALALFIAKKATSLFNKINHQILSVLIIIFLLAMSAAFAGINGILIMIVGTAIGVIPQIKGTARSHSMSCLIIPIIINNMSKIAI